MESGFTSQVCHSLAVTIACHLTSLSLSFPLCKMGIDMRLFSRSGCQLWQVLNNGVILKNLVIKIKFIHLRSSFWVSIPSIVQWISKDEQNTAFTFPVNICERAL